MGALFVLPLLSLAGNFQADYDAAYKTYQAASDRDLKLKAAQLFEALTVRPDGGTLTPNAWYWLGECWYDLKDYPQALTCFERTLLYPQSNKEEAARFKVGMCYVRLGWSEAARWELSRFMRDYPRSDLLNIVRRELEKLPGERK